MKGQYETIRNLKFIKSKTKSSEYEVGEYSKYITVRQPEVRDLIFAGSQIIVTIILYDYITSAAKYYFTARYISSSLY